MKTARLCTEQTKAISLLIYAVFFSPVKLVVAKCWDPNPRGYVIEPAARQEPVRPIDPSAWVAHMEAIQRDSLFQSPMLGGGPPFGDSSTTISSSIMSSVPDGPDNCKLQLYFINIIHCLLFSKFIVHTVITVHYDPDYSMLTAM